MIQPPFLKPGDTIGVMAPSSRVTREDLEGGKLYLENKGYKVFLHPQCFEAFNQSAGTHEQKISALHDLAADKNISAVIFAGGGNRSLHILDDINYALIASNPKAYMGFSDCTALLNAISARSNLTTWHGPVLKRVATTPQMEINLSLLEGRTKEIDLSGAHIFKEGIAEGIVIGGNMSIVFAMNEHDFCLNNNYILLLEDIGEEWSHFDRMLCAMKHRGVLKNAGGIIFGQFTDMKDTGAPFGFSFEDIVREHTQGLDIPIILNAPFGHNKQLNIALPIGWKAKIEGLLLRLA